jgi:hypothetical protein
MVGLQPVGHDPKQQMAGKVKGRRLAEHGVPAAPQLVDAEITQSRDLGIDLLAVQRRGTDPQPGHRLQAERRFGRREPALRPPAAPVIRYTLTPSTLLESSVIQSEATEILPGVHRGR